MSVGNELISIRRVSRDYIDADLSSIEPPTLMRHFNRATSRIAEAIRDQQSIFVFGDYDVDGVTSARIMHDFIKRSGGNVTAKVSKRSDGYGFKELHQQSLPSGTNLLIILDCGTNDDVPVRAAQESGVDVVIIDHHQISKSSPGHSLVNPHHPECRFSAKHLCTAGLVFYVITGVSNLIEDCDIDTREWLDFVAVATLADSMTLDKTNRGLVKAGIRRIPNRPVWSEIAGIDEINSSDISWKIAPVLNAPGRLGDAAPAFLALGGDSNAAQDCKALNAQRKQIQNECMDDALEQIYNGMDNGIPHFIIVWSNDWTPGCVGPVATRLAERFERPALVVAVEDGVGRGSARSFPPVDICELFRRHESLLMGCGGHAYAAGLQIDPGNIEAFREALCESLKDVDWDRAERPARWDMGISTKDIEDFDVEKNLKNLEPFGKGFPRPKFVARDEAVKSVRRFGANGAEVTLVSGERLVIFRGGDAVEDGVKTVSFTYTVQKDHYNGGRQLIAEDIIK